MKTSLKLIRFVFFAGGCLLFIFMAVLAIWQGGDFQLKGILMVLVLAATSGWLAVKTYRGGALPSDHVDESGLEVLEKQGMITSSEHLASRAIEIEEYEDEGMCYLVELSDGTTLCVRGQYLYEFEDASRFGEGPTTRRFPNTRFQVKRHRESGQIMELVPLGEAFDPLLTIPSNVFCNYQASEILQDGETTRLSFDVLIANKGRLPNPPTDA